MSAACATVPVVTAAVDLDDETMKWACELAADFALDDNNLVIIVGALDVGVHLCMNQCALLRPGVLVVVPDVDVIAMGGAPEGSARMERADGRVAYVFPGVEPTR